MLKTKLQISVLVLLWCLKAFSQENYPLHIKGVDKDAAFITKLGVPSSFTTRNDCVSFINKLPGLLQAKGYVTASVDSIIYDSAFAKLVLFTGDRYEWAQLDIKGIDPSVSEAVGLRVGEFGNKPMDFAIVKLWQERLLTYMENNGYPFAKVYLDSLQMEGEKVFAQLKLEKGYQYKIDSIRVNGTAKISNDFLQRYLDIRNGSTFNREKLLQVSRRMRELSFVEEESPSKLIWLGSGSILEMNLKQKRSSQVNVLVGFLPNNDQLSSRKLLVTGEANLNLKNALGNGETIGLNWQQLQVKSPRLNLVYQHPYVFKSPVGVDFAFNMFRKDSTFLNVNFELGGRYALSSNQTGKLFIQRFSTIVSVVNTNYILQNYRLPSEADVGTTNAGFEYEWNNTNYRLNPVRGNELRVITTVGIKKVRKNNEVLELKDPSNPSFDFERLYDTVKLKTYQLGLRLSAAKYFPLGQQGRSTIKAGLNGGFLQSQNIFRNELYQIGGYKLLRGFDEESQYLSQFMIGTAELRYLVGQNSYFYAFTDGGWGRNKSQNVDVSYTYIGTGLGLAFETKVGIFNMAWAIGKRSDLEFNLRQSKIHFGFVSYF